MGDSVLIQNGMMVCGGWDEGGYYAQWGPATRTIIAIMVLQDGDWVPYKMYKDNSPKNLKRAKHKRKLLRRKYNARFRVEEIWETVPQEEMEKRYYDTAEEIAKEIVEATGIPEQHVRLGLTRPGTGT